MAKPVQDPGEIPFGEGDMPKHFDRLNWAALLMPMIISLGFGSFGWFAFFMIFRAVTNQLVDVALAVSGAAGSRAAVFGTLFLWGVINAAVSSAYALRANRVAWTNCTSEVKDGFLAQTLPRFSTTTQFERFNRFAAKLALVLFAGSTVIGVLLNESGLATAVLAIAQTAAGWLAVVGVVQVVLRRRRFSV
ncbi:MAG: hypothetical protein AB2L09_08480 [Coriobacteriia bacterium]